MLVVPHDELMLIAKLHREFTYFSQSGRAGLGWAGLAEPSYFGRMTIIIITTDSLSSCENNFTFSTIPVQLRPSWPRCLTLKLLFELPGGLFALIDQLSGVNYQMSPVRQSSHYAPPPYNNKDKYQYTQNNSPFSSVAVDMGKESQSFRFNIAQTKQLY